MDACDMTDKACVDAVDTNFDADEARLDRVILEGKEEEMEEAAEEKEAETDDWTNSGSDDHKADVRDESGEVDACKDIESDSDKSGKFLCSKSSAFETDDNEEAIDDEDGWFKEVEDAFGDGRSPSSSASNSKKTNSSSSSKSSAEFELDKFDKSDCEKADVHVDDDEKDAVFGTGNARRDGDDNEASWGDGLEADCCL